MSRNRGWSRRRLIGAALGTTGLLGAPTLAQEVEIGDRGLGGTGVVPSEATGDDRGIGGTGVVGTIRRFGSILVNDLRISFPRSVEVWIDGRPARLGDLHVGHVVHVLAQTRGAGLDTQRIEVFSQIVGAIEAVTPESITVLGQTVMMPTHLSRAGLRVGRKVAVSGLRRLDGIVIASFIGRHRGRTAQTTGIPARSTDGSVSIGALPLEGLPADVIGQPMRVSGRLIGGRLLVEDAQPQWAGLLAQRPARLSIEDYVMLDHGRLKFASGLHAPDDLTPEAAFGETRAIISASVVNGGQVHVESMRVEGHEHRGDGPDGLRDATQAWPGHGPTPMPDAVSGHGPGGTGSGEPGHPGGGAPLGPSDAAGGGFGGHGPSGANGHGGPGGGRR